MLLGSARDLLQPLRSTLEAQSEGPLWDQDFLVLGLLAHLLAGLFLLSSVGRGRPSYRLQQIIGEEPISLSAVRDGIHAKARGQAGAVFFVFGSLMLLCGFLLPGPADARLQLIGAAIMVLASVLFLLLLDRYVGGKLRRYLRAHLRQHPFDFEDHVGLTRDIGELFEVPSTKEETLESYVAKVRDVLGITEPPSRLFGRPARRW